MVPPRVLIVDDDPGVLFALRRLLESAGAMRTMVAPSAEAAEVELAHGAVDAMVLDFRLCGMRGDAFYHRACTLQPSLAERTVFITGDVAPAANAAIAATGCPFLLKPFLTSALLAMVRDLAARATPRNAPARDARSA